MSRDEVGKALGAWVGKGTRVGSAHASAEAGLNLKRTDQVLETDALAQLNFKVPRSMKSRIKQLAARDNITLLAMLYHMVDLYEAEHGGLTSAK